MPDWLREILTVAVAAVITAALLGFLRSRGARARRAALGAGKPLKFDAFLRADAAPYPRRWRLGWLMIGVGPPMWKPRFSLLRRPLALPVSATVEQIRRVAGLRETVFVNPECRIIVARAGNVNLELALMEIDVITALQALDSGSGGGWRVPVPTTIEEMA